MNVTKGPGDLPPFEPADSIWDDEEWVAQQITETRKEWLDRVEEAMLECLYVGDADDFYKFVHGTLTEMIEKRAEASRYPPH